MLELRALLQLLLEVFGACLLHALFASQLIFTLHNCLVLDFEFFKFLAFHGELVLAVGQVLVLLGQLLLESLDVRFLFADDVRLLLDLLLKLCGALPCLLLAV